MQKEFVRSQFSFNVESVELDVAAIHRGGELCPVVFLHGFGSTKEDYADIVRYTAFAGHPILAYDAPGCGETHCSDLSQISIPFLVETALAVLECVNFERFFDDFIERTCHAPVYSSALYAANLRHKVRASAVRGIFQSMVELSDNGRSDKQVPQPSLP